jgi:hypothetical protein
MTLELVKHVEHVKLCLNVVYVRPGEIDVTDGDVHATIPSEAIRDTIPLDGTYVTIEIPESLAKEKGLVE